MKENPGDSFFKASLSGKPESSRTSDQTYPAAKPEHTAPDRTLKAEYSEMRYELPARAGEWEGGIARRHDSCHLPVL
ncbi:MAG TPA: hypothetical protein V6D08_18690 [Candidatus Obscuribacterales bacterium]